MRHTSKVEKLDACIRPLFANLVTYINDHYIIMNTVAVFRVGNCV